MKKYIKRIICTIFAISMILVGTIHSDAYVHGNTLRAGNKIYYLKTTYVNEVFCYSDLYRKSVSGRNVTYIGTLYHGETLKAYYKGRLFLEGDLGGDYSSVYAYNLKTKKEYLIKRDGEIDSQKGRYLLLGRAVGDYNPHNVSVYNAYSRKLHKISSTGSDAKFLNGKVYYSDLKYLYSKNKSKRKISIKTSSYTGSHKKTLCTIHFSNYAYVQYIGKSYVKYGKSDLKGNSHTYKYYYSSKRVVKLD